MEKEKVYVYSAEYAALHNQTELYNESMKRNAACARAIENAFSRRPDKPRDIPGMTKTILNRYGSVRVSWVCANTVQITNDGRYSKNNNEWASRFEIPDGKDRLGMVINLHPATLDNFIYFTRKEMAMREILALENCETNSKSEESADETEEQNGGMNMNQ